MLEACVTLRKGLEELARSDSANPSYASFFLLCLSVRSFRMVAVPRVPFRLPAFDLPPWWGMALCPRISGLLRFLLGEREKKKKGREKKKNIEEFRVYENRTVKKEKDDDIKVSREGARVWM